MNNVKKTFVFLKNIIIIIIFLNRSTEIVIEKNFMKGNKKVRYPAKTWFAAEKFFKVVSGAQEKGTNVKLNVDGDMFLISNVWTCNNQRYTGIHQVNIQGHYGERIM